jgi:hypothetical protein
MRHFVHYPNGGPYPGSCATCGSPKDFFDTGIDSFNNGKVLLCRSCIADLGYNIGFALEAPLRDEIAALQAQIQVLNEMIVRIPNLTEGLIDGIRNRVANFILDVSSSSDSDSPETVPSTPEDHSGDGEGIDYAKSDPEARDELTQYKRPASVPASSSRNKRPDKR